VQTRGGAAWNTPVGHATHAAAPRAGLQQALLHDAAQGALVRARGAQHQVCPELRLLGPAPEPGLSTSRDRGTDNVCTANLLSASSASMS